MIQNQWYVILESRQVKAGKLVGVTRLGEKMVLWRDGSGGITCMSDLCPHRGVALSAGKLKGDCVECPFHGFLYDSSGRCTLIPANGKDAPVPKAFQVKTYPAREEHGFIYIWNGEPRNDLPPVPFFDSIDENQYSISSFIDPWPTHYSRAIENQLDVVHLPFVHYNTIGRGNRTLVNGPLYQVKGCPGNSDIIDVWVYNEADQGQKPQAPEEMPSPQRHPFVQFRFPNLWHNWISDSFHLVLAFVPVNEENTLMYIRQYQKMVKVPVLRQLVDWSGLLSSFYIERQDRRIVITQRPKRSSLRMGEKLIQGDGPVIVYRRRREELIEADQR